MERSTLKTCAQYIADAKAALGDERMSDADFGARLRPPFAQQTISKAKSGEMSDSVALAVGEVLARKGKIDYPGELLLVAHAERDANPAVRKALLDYAKNVVGRLPQRVLSLLAGLTLAGGLTLSPHDAYAVGGAGGKRT